MWLYTRAMYIFILIACVGLVAISGSITLARRRGRSRPGLRFPGPRQSPLIGRVHDLPKRSMWLKLKEWADVHGPIYETSMMGTRFIVVSSEAIAEELLIKKGNHFGGRMQIRALIEHKAGPVYVALQDRNGNVDQPAPCHLCGFVTLVFFLFLFPFCFSLLAC